MTTKPKPNGVTRYKAMDYDSLGGPRVKESPDGEYMLASEYEKLEAYAQSLRALCSDCLLTLGELPSRRYTAELMDRLRSALGQHGKDGEK